MISYEIFRNIKKIKFLPAFYGIVSMVCFGFAVYCSTRGCDFIRLIGELIVPGIFMLSQCIHLQIVWENSSCYKIWGLINNYSGSFFSFLAVYFFYETRDIYFLICFAVVALICFLGAYFVYKKDKT